MAKPSFSYKPDFSFEQKYLEQGYRVSGIDEVGRGCLAGPVFVSGVVLDPNNIPDGLHDSKKLTAKRRKALYDQILATSEFSLTSVPSEVIDEINIREATLQGMAEAAALLGGSTYFHLIDGNAIPKRLVGRAESIIKGDARSLSIAAASIVAKVTRDEWMTAAAEMYPGYGFEKHAGYGTESHLAAIRELGPCPLHRMSFRPLKPEVKAA